MSKHTEHLVHLLDANPNTEDMNFSVTFINVSKYKKDEPNKSNT